MAATPAGTESTRDVLQRAADHLEAVSVPEFEQAFAPLFERRADFDPERDALDVELVPTSERGIGDWAASHRRVRGDDPGCRWRRPFQRGYHPATVAAVHPVGHALRPADLLQGLFEVLVHHLTEPDPRAGLSNRTLKVALYRPALAQPSIH